MKKACVIGWPISHSRSPIIHNYWLRQHRIEGHYGVVSVLPADLPAFIMGLVGNGYAGCNVTIPHKEAVFALLENKDERATRIGAVNTIYKVGGNLRATNTDGEGFIANVKATLPGMQLAGAKVSILGAGGSAMAIIGALLDENVAEIALFNRSSEKSQILRKRFGRTITPLHWDKRNEFISDSSLLINATSLGMTAQPPLDIRLDALPSNAAVADIVYSPLLTPLLMEATSRGLPIVKGLGMLLHQAVRGFELWFGVRPSVTQDLYDLVARDIDPAYLS